SSHFGVTPERGEGPSVLARRPLPGPTQPSGLGLPQEEPPPGCRCPWPASRGTRLTASREGVGCGTPSRWAFSLVPTQRRARPWLPVVGVGWRGRRWNDQRRTVRRPRECCTRRCARATRDVLPVFG